MIQITPYLDQTTLGEYQDKILELHNMDTSLHTSVPVSIRSSVEWLLKSVNCFYSNRIEGNATHPKDFLRSQSKVGNDREKLNDEIVELLAHLEAQIKFSELTATDELNKETFVKSIHEAFYDSLPKHLLQIRKSDGTVATDDEGNPLYVTPGEYRKIDVTVGAHTPPVFAQVPGYMNWFSKMYHTNIHGTQPVVTIAAMHHRLAWIHPFADGNGRVLRMLTDCYMKNFFGGYNLWSITRGFGRDTTKYYEALKEADKPNQGSTTDGKGILSDRGLTFFTKYFIDTAYDQVKFFSALLEPTRLRRRINIYFDMRIQGAYPIADKELPQLRIEARDIYLALLDNGPMTRQAICQRVGKGDQTLRSTFKQMAEEKLIRMKPKQPISLMLSAEAVEILFPQIW